MSKPRVAVVIPNWNGEDYIAECLQSLQAQTLKPHVIVVDNGSSDRSVQIIESNFPSVELLKFSDNAGFAGGVNRGIRKAIEAKFEFIVLFNNDAFADKGWVTNLVKAAEEHPDAGIVTGKFLRSDKRHIDSTGEQYSTWGMPFPRSRNQIDKGQFDTGEYVFAATGGASLYRTTMLNKIGLFDEAFFAYLEDVDISFRAQLAGWKVWYEPSAVAYHHVSGTATKLGNFSRYHTIKNFILLYDKNMPGWLFWKYKPLFLLQLTRMKIGTLRDGEFLLFPRALLAATVRIPRALWQRRGIQKNRKVTVAYIASILHKGRPPRTPKI